MFRKILNFQIIFISWEQFLQGDTWTDFVLWESEEDADEATTIGKNKEVTNDFYACIYFLKVSIHHYILVHPCCLQNPRKLFPRFHSYTSN
mgnify:CR=1 FL=1